MVEHQLPKLGVAGSSPVFRSTLYTKHILSIYADVAQVVEHFLGKEEVTGSSPVTSSRKYMV